MVNKLAKRREQREKIALQNDSYGSFNKAIVHEDDISSNSSCDLHESLALDNQAFANCKTSSSYKIDEIY